MKKKNTGHKHAAVFLSGVMLAVFFLSAGDAGGIEKTAVYFHSSETNINNFKSLKMEFDKYLSQYGPYELQPVKERSEFEKQISLSKDCLFLVSSWHYQRILNRYPCRPVLVGTRNGKKTQKRLLVVRRDLIPPLSAASNIASASSFRHTRNVMKSMPIADHIIDELKILTVPKDIDALMAVSFGMSGAALITENSYDRIRRITPVLCRKVKIIATGPEIHLLILALPEKTLAKHQHLIQVIKNMPETPQGRKQIQMLGLDSFQDVSSDDMMRLQATIHTSGQQEKK